GGGADYRDGKYGAGAGRAGRRSRARLRGLGRGGAAAEIGGWRATTWRPRETRRTDDPPPADHWSKCRGSTGQPARCTQGIVAPAGAGSPRAKGWPASTW